MIEIRYSAPYDLDISGTVDELQFVRREILNLAQSDASQIAFDADSTIDPAPYNCALSKLLVMKGQCPTRASVKNESELIIEGSPENLEEFTSYFNFDSNAKKGDHSHHEYFEGLDQIAPDSIPLVISVK